MIQPLISKAIITIGFFCTPPMYQIPEVVVPIPIEHKCLPTRIENHSPYCWDDFDKERIDKQHLACKAMHKRGNIRSGPCANVMYKLGYRRHRVLCGPEQPLLYHRHRH